MLFKRIVVKEAVEYEVVISSKVVIPPKYKFSYDVVGYLTLALHSLLNSGCCFRCCFLEVLDVLALDLFVCLFDLILYVPSTIFQLNRDGSS